MNVPFCGHCAPLQAAAAMRGGVHPAVFPLYCDSCGYVTRLITLDELRARLRRDGVPMDDVPPGSNCVLFCEAPEAQA